MLVGLLLMSAVSASAVLAGKEPLSWWYYSEGFDPLLFTVNVPVRMAIHNLPSMHGAAVWSCEGGLESVHACP